MENASRTYTYSKLKAMIERKKEMYGWEFLFLGANIDAAREAARFGIKNLLLEGGSILNGAFQRAGVIDELSLVVDPVIGGEGKPLCMDSKVEEYRLVDLKNHNGILWLNYKK